MEHRLGADARCPECGALLGADSGELHEESCERHQVFELPAIRVEVVEHRAERRVCPACATAVTAAFPAGVTSPVQYSESVQAAAVYFNVRQMIPYARTAELLAELLADLLADLFACPMSQGTLANFVKRTGAKASVAMEAVREKLVHADEWSGAT